MAASRAARLAPVIEMAERAERDAARLLGQAQTQLTQAEASWPNSSSTSATISNSGCSRAARAYPASG